MLTLDDSMINGADSRLYPFTFGDGLKLYYDAKYSKMAQNSDGSTPALLVGDPVGYVEDISGSGLNFTQTVGARRWTLETVNGNLVPVNDGVDDFAFTTANAIFTTDPFTMAVKFSVNALPSVRAEAAYIAAGMTPQYPMIRLRASDDKIVFVNKDTTPTVYTIVSDAAISVDTDIIVICTVDNAHVMKIYVDGVLQVDTTTMTNHTLPDAAVYMQLGAFSATTSRQSGSVNKLLFLSQALNSDEVTILTDYLSND